MKCLIKLYGKDKADTFHSAAGCKQLPSVLPQVAREDEAELHEWKWKGGAQLH